MYFAFIGGEFSQFEIVGQKIRPTTADAETLNEDWVCDKLF